MIPMHQYPSPVVASLASASPRRKTAKSTADLSVVSPRSSTGGGGGGDGVGDGYTNTNTASIRRTTDGIIDKNINFAKDEQKQSRSISSVPLTPTVTNTTTAVMVKRRQSPSRNNGGGELYDGITAPNRGSGSILTNNEKNAHQGRSTNNSGTTNSSKNKNQINNKAMNSENSKNNGITSYQQYHNNNNPHYNNYEEHFDDNFHTANGNASESFKMLMQMDPFVNNKPYNSNHHYQRNQLSSGNYNHYNGISDSHDNSNEQLMMFCNNINPQFQRHQYQYEQKRHRQRQQQQQQQQQNYDHDGSASVLTSKSHPDDEYYANTTSVSNNAPNESIHSKNSVHSNPSGGRCSDVFPIQHQEPAIAHRGAMNGFVHNDGNTNTVDRSFCDINNETVVSLQYHYNPPRSPSHFSLDLQRRSSHSGSIPIITTTSSYGGGSCKDDLQDEEKEPYHGYDSMYRLGSRVEELTGGRTDGNPSTINISAKTTHRNDGTRHTIHTKERNSKNKNNDYTLEADEIQPSGSSDKENNTNGTVPSKADYSGASTSWTNDNSNYNMPPVVAPTAGLGDTVVIVGTETNDCAQFTHSYLILAYASGVLARQLARISPQERSHSPQDWHDNNINHLHQNLDHTYRLCIPNKPATEWRLLQFFLEPHTVHSAQVTIQNLPPLLPWFQELQWTVQLQSCDELMVGIASTPLAVYDGVKLNLQDQLLMLSRQGRSFVDDNNKNKNNNNNNNNMHAGNSNTSAHDRDECAREGDSQELDLQRQALLDLIYFTRIACKANLTQAKQMGLSALANSLMEQESVWLYQPLPVNTDTNETGKDNNPNRDSTPHNDDQKSKTPSKQNFKTRTPISRFSGLLGILLDCLRKNIGVESLNAPEVTKTEVKKKIAKTSSHTDDLSTPNDANDNDKSDEFESDSCTSQEDRLYTNNQGAVGQKKILEHFDTIEARQLFQAVMLYLPSDMIYQNMYIKYERIDSSNLKHIKSFLQNPLFPYLLRQGMISTNHKKQFEIAQGQLQLQQQQLRQYMMSMENASDEEKRGIHPQARPHNSTGGHQMTPNGENTELLMSNPTNYNDKNNNATIMDENQRHCPMYDPNNHPQITKVTEEIKASIWKLSSWIMGNDENKSDDDEDDDDDDDDDEDDDDDDDKDEYDGVDKDHENKVKETGTKQLNSNYPKTKPLNYISVAQPTITSIEQRREWLQLVWQKLEEPPVFASRTNGAGASKATSTNNNITTNSNVVRTRSRAKVFADVDMESSREESLTYSETTSEKTKLKDLHQINYKNGVGGTDRVTNPHRQFQHSLQSPDEQRKLKQKRKQKPKQKQKQSSQPQTQKHEEQEPQQHHCNNIATEQKQRQKHQSVLVDQNAFVPLQRSLTFSC